MLKQSDFLKSLFVLTRISNYQGHIALDQAVFPEDTPGFVLDAFARSFLWKVGLDYRHGIFLLHVEGRYSST
jgi:hypothetical protein